MGSVKKLIEIDQRGRASLGQLARHGMYLGEVQPDGRIILDPVQITPLATAPPPKRRGQVTRRKPDAAPTPVAEVMEPGEA